MADKTKWKTFPDFLGDYIKSVLGGDWGNAELKKPPEQQHQIIRWYGALCRWQRNSTTQRPEGNGEFSAVPIGPVSAYLCLAHDLYTIEHNAKLQAEVIRRLKHAVNFQGARYELFVAATMIRAGFEINYEDETDGTRKHPEFIAVHKKTKASLAVEAKSRHRPGVLGRAGEEQESVQAGMKYLLANAIEKRPEHPYAIFLDTNLPPLPADVFASIGEKATGLAKELQDTVDQAPKRIGSAKDDFNMVFFTNIPHYYGDEEEVRPRSSFLSILTSKPERDQRVAHLFEDTRKALLHFENIPNHFPGA